MRNLFPALVTIASLVLTAPIAAQATVSPPHQAPGARAQTIERLLQVSEMERVHRETLDGMITSQLRSDSVLALYEDLYREFMTRHLSFAAVKPELVRIYAETFTDAELEALIRFYTSDGGRSVMAKLPDVTVKSAEMGMRRAREAMPELIAAIQQRAEQQERVRQAQAKRRGA